MWVREQGRRRRRPSFGGLERVEGGVQQSNPRRQSSSERAAQWASLRSLEVVTVVEGSEQKWLREKIVDAARGDGD